MLEKSIVKRSKTFEDCIALARLLFQENFYNQITQLLYNFPPDQVDILFVLFKFIVFGYVYILGRIKLSIQSRYS